MHWPKVRVKGDVPGWTEKQKSGSPAGDGESGKKAPKLFNGNFSIRGEDSVPSYRMEIQPTGSAIGYRRYFLTGILRMDRAFSPSPRSRGKHQRWRKEKMITLKAGCEGNDRLCCQRTGGQWEAQRTRKEEEGDICGAAERLP